jgi:hypothetical protein
MFGARAAADAPVGEEHEAVGRVEGFGIVAPFAAHGTAFEENGGAKAGPVMHCTAFNVGDQSVDFGHSIAIRRFSHLEGVWLHLI